MTEIGALGSPKLKKMKRSEKRFNIICVFCCLLTTVFYGAVGWSVTRYGYGKTGRVIAIIILVRDIRYG